MVHGRSFSTRKSFAWFALVTTSIVAIACDSGRSAHRSSATASTIAALDSARTNALTSASFVEDTRGGRVARSWTSATKAQGLTLGAHLPPSARGAIDIGLATTSEASSGAQGDFTLRFTHAGLADAKLVNDDGRATYRDVAPETDLLVTADEDHIEWFYLLQNAAAPSRFDLHVELPKGLPRATLRADGSLAFLDPRGHAKLAIASPSAVDARGVSRRVTLGWDAAHAELEVSIDPQGLTYPILIDPTVAYPLWEQVDAVSSNVPPTREGEMIVYDSARKKTVLFGGYNLTADYFGDTWEWDGTTWTQAVVSVSPPVRELAMMAYDSARQKTVLFGGVGYGSYGNFLNDTWEWDGTTWTRREVSTSPPARFQGAMAYDSTRGKCVLYGGDNAGPGPVNASHYTPLGDTWEWDGTTWVQQFPTRSPPAGGSGAMAFDSGRGKAVLLGGDIGSDVFEWDGTNWTPRYVSYKPSGRYAFGLAYDSARGRTVLFGGATGTNPYLQETWEWSGTSWSQRSPATTPIARLGAPMAYDSTRGKTVLFGGYDGAYLDDTWEWDGTNWAAPSVSTLPTVRIQATMAYDTARGETVLFGGSTAGAVMLADTWAWNGTWTQRTPATSPPARHQAAMAYDSVRGKAVLFGGDTTYNETGLLADIWQWDGTNWASPSVASSPSARYQAAMAFDSARGKTVLFGGLANGTFLGDTWEWDGTAWTSLSPTTAPSGRAASAIAYDSTRGRIVLFGGQTGTSSYGSDTWEWDGTNWASRSATVSPPARYEAAMAYDVPRQRSVLFGGYYLGSIYLNDTWEWDGTSWNNASTTSPAARSNHTMAFDPRHGVLLFGGEINYVGSNDTWLYFTVAAGCTTTATCDSGNCVDGVCCAQSQCGACQSCALAGSEGQCTNVPAGTVPSTGDVNACPATNVCTADGVCAVALGGTCAADSDCFTGFCTDGVCCDSACTGDCQACSKARGLSTNGTCAFAAEGTNGRNACPNNLTCNGKGPECPTSCTGDASCATGYYCASSGTCAPQRVEGQACDDAAGADCLAAGCQECTSGHCVDGACCASCQGTTALGGTCTSDAACASDHCIDGVCCQDACGSRDGGSDTCQIGVCLASNDYKCSLPVGVACRAASCTGNVQTFVAICNGGACGDLQTKKCAPYACGATCSGDGASVISNTGAATSCSPYVCAGSACKTTCGSVNDCASGFVCGSSGQCAAAGETGVPGGGCGCRVASAPRSNGIMLAVIVVLVAARRRRLYSARLRQRMQPSVR